MTEPEALEVMAAHGANAITSFTIYVSVTFAYLAATHLVGAKLSRFQCVGISALYVFSASSVALSQTA